jgi:hypothetical protein
LIKGIDEQKIDTQKLAAQISSHDSWREIMVQNTETIVQRLEKLASSITETVNNGKEGHTQTKTYLEKIETTIATLTAASWIQEALQSSDLPQQADISEIYKVTFLKYISGLKDTNLLV